MKIGVIGAGNVGTALGRSLAAAGHEVIYGLRPGSLPSEDTTHERASTASVREAIAASDVLLLATPWAKTEAALTEAGDLGGRPLLDATNPIGAGMALTHAGQDSGGEAVQRWAKSARVVKIFNTTGRENMLSPRFGEQRALMLACSDDSEALDIAVRLASDIGFEALPLGPLKNARILEPFGRVWIELALVRGQGRGIAFGLLRR